MARKEFTSAHGKARVTGVGWTRRRQIKIPTLKPQAAKKLQIQNSTTSPGYAPPNDEPMMPFVYF
jgi:hypothetical protein